MIEPVFDRDCFKVLGVFAVSPGSRFRREEIKEKTRLNNVPLDKALVKLANCHIVKIQRGFYSLDFESENSKKLVEIVSKQQKELRDVPLVVFLLLTDLVDALSTVKGVEVWLFGSYAKLIYREKSDVDVAVIFEKMPKGLDLGRLGQKLEKTYGKQIQIHDFEKGPFYKNKNDPLVSDILRNGVRLL
jgi:predicted nucleotidyltransferase